MCEHTNQPQETESGYGKVIITRSDDAKNEEPQHVVFPDFDPAGVTLDGLVIASPDDNQTKEDHMYDMSNDWDALETQATETAAYYLHKAIRYIDESFTDGYAMNHPELVIAFMDICQRDFATSAKNVRHRAEMEMREREIEE